MLLAVSTTFHDFLKTTLNAHGERYLGVFKFRIETSPLTLSQHVITGLGGMIHAGLGPFVSGDRYKS